MNELKTLIHASFPDFETASCIIMFKSNQIKLNELSVMGLTLESPISIHTTFNSRKIHVKNSKKPLFLEK